MKGQTVVEKVETTATIACPDGTILEDVPCSLNVHQDGGLRAWEGDEA